MNRSEAARRLAVTRDRLSGWEREGLAHVERDERNRPKYADAEVTRLAAALHTGALSAPPRAAQPRSTRHLALAPASQLVAQLPADEAPIAQLAQVPAQPLVRSAQHTKSVPAAVVYSDNDPEVVAKLVAAQRSRAEVQRLAAEIDEIRARAEHAEVVRALHLQNRRRRVDEIVAHAVGVPEVDRDLAEQIGHARMAGVEAATMAWDYATMFDSQMHDGVPDVPRSRRRRRRR